MATKKTAPPKKVKIKLTEEQKKALVEAFGASFVGRLKTIDLEQIEGYVAARGKVSIDLGGVFSISESYADELFGVLALRYGLGWLSDNVAFHNQNHFVFRAIASAIRQRLISKSPEAPDIALLAARKALKQRQSRST